MQAKLFTFLKHEQQLIKELIAMAELQQKALVEFRLSELEKIAGYQESLAQNLRDAEEQRIRMLMAWLGAQRRDVVNMRLSALEKFFQSEELMELKKLKKSMRAMLERLQALNTTNRVLSNRARKSVQNIISVFTDGRNHVCNVKV
ncbi:MAG: flagellar protein FlgN [Candidatus Kapaibacterium sp.]